MRLLGYDERWFAMFQPTLDEAHLRGETQIVTAAVLPFAWLPAKNVMTLALGAS